MEFKYSKLSIYIDIYEKRGSKIDITVTRLRIPFKIEKLFKLKVYKKGFFFNLEKKLGM